MFGRRSSRSNYKRTNSHAERCSHINYILHYWIAHNASAHDIPEIALAGARPNERTNSSAYAHYQNTVSPASISYAQSWPAGVCFAFPRARWPLALAIICHGHTFAVGENARVLGSREEIKDLHTLRVHFDTCGAVVVRHICYADMSRFPTKY